MELMTSYEEKLGKMEEDEISGEKILTDRQVEMLQAEDERNYYSSRDENPYRQYQKVTNRLKKFKKKQVILTPMDRPLLPKTVHFDPSPFTLDKAFFR